MFHRDTREFLYFLQSDSAAQQPNPKHTKRRRGKAADTQCLCRRSFEKREDFPQTLWEKREEQAFDYQDQRQPRKKVSHKKSLSPATAKLQIFAVADS